MNDSRFICIDGFWNEILYENRNSPIFTNCFQFSLLLIASLSSLTMIILYLNKYVYDNQRKTTKIYSLKCRRIVEFIVPIFSAIFSIIDMMNEFYYSEVKDPLLFLSFVIFATSLIIVAVLIKIKHYGITAIDYIIFLFWWLTNGAYGIRFYSNLNKVFKQSNTFEIFILINSTFLMLTLLMSLFFNSFQKFSIDSEKNENPEAESSIFSKITVLWMDKYIFQWFKEEMTNETSFDLGSEYESELNTKNVEEIFHRLNSKRENQNFNTQTLLLDESKNDHCSRNTGMILLKSLLKNYYHLYIIVNVFKLLRDIIYLMLPLLLGVLMEYFILKEKQYLWKGILFAFIFLILGIIAAISENFSHTAACRIAVSVQAALLGMIYKKVLKLSTKTRKENDSGDITNMCIVDIEQINLCLASICGASSTPFQIIVCFGLMYLQVGPAIIGGVTLIILIIPAHIIFLKVVYIFSKKEFQWKDKRMNIITEILKGIKIIKMYTWEKFFYSKSSYNRDMEMKNMCSVMIVSYTYYTFTYLLTLLLMYTNLMAYIYFVPMPDLTATKVFVMITYTTYVKYAVSTMMMFTNYTFKVFESLKRIEKFLLSSEINLEALCSRSKESDSEEAVEIENGFFGWNENEKCILRNLNLSIKKGKLVAVVGKVGVGKSTLLSTILRETCAFCGSIKTQGSFALVSQEAWIQNTSLRDNILFTKVYDETLYNTVTEACCLDYDINLLPMKDESEIGEGGINLSGGQKQRISLARAIYQDKDIYLLDDPLSAVDIKVGEKIFNNIIGKNGLLKQKTRILVTHGIKWLPYMDEIIFINSEGEISEKGTFECLMNLEGGFQHFINECSSHFKSNIEENKNFDQETKEKDSNSVSELYEKDYNNKISEEKIMVGKVPLETVWWYIKANGAGLFIFSVLICFAFFFLDAYGSYWLSGISKFNRSKNTMNFINNTNFYKYYINNYGLIILAQLIFAIFYMTGFAYCSLRASKKIYDDLLKNILNATLTFFDFTPSGRILNRFGKDLFVIDHVLILNIIYMTRLFCISMVFLSLIIFVTPWFGLALIPTIILFFLLQNFYISSSRQSARLNSKASAFILTNVVETYKGSSIIKSFEAEEDFQNKQYSYINNSNKFLFINYFSIRWFSLRLDILCNFVVFAAIIFAVIYRQNLDDGLAGLSISSALQISANLNFLMKRFSEFEVNSVAIERIREYTDIANESERDNKKRFPLDWAPRGNISFEQFSLKYHTENPLVLRNISLHVLGGEKVGVVGRTGAGKSSLALALFRLIEGCGGDIFIDGINIKSVGLKELRKQITILPQDPVIFSGSLRHNLDPFDEYSTEKIIESLEISGLLEWVNSLKENIDFICESMGNNLSVGQKQLLCLARTVLRKTKLIIFDEATASVDEDTGQKVMSAVKSKFIDSTVFIIAHRINTIINCDKILLLDNGSILEYGSPEELLSNVNGFFKSMIIHGV